MVNKALFQELLLFMNKINEYKIVRGTKQNWMELSNEKIERGSTSGFFCFKSNISFPIVNRKGTCKIEG